MATDAEKIVTDFCNAWPRKNVDELLAFFTDDAVYHNIPVEPAKGKEQSAASSTRSCRWPSRSTSKC